MMLDGLGEEGGVNQTQMEKKLGQLRAKLQGRASQQGPCLGVGRESSGGMRVGSRKRAPRMRLPGMLSKAFTGHVTLATARSCPWACSLQTLRSQDH